MNEHTILLVEDEPGHAHLISRNLERKGWDGEIMVVDDGEPALNRLLRRGEFANTSLPSAVLLDLNLPRVSGVEVLQQIYLDPQAREVPVIILTTSDEPEDISACWDLGYTEYMVKPPDYRKLYERIRGLVERA
jgi:DNA-binding response OmpR family regulator